MPRALQLLSFAATALAFIFNAAAGIIGQDAFETSKLSVIWNQAQNVSIQNPEGANGARGFARLSSDGGKLVGTLMIPNGSDHGLSDYSIEFYFRTQNATNSQFSLQIEGSETATATSFNPALNLCYEARKGWGISAESKGVIFWKPITGMKPISSDAWYHFRFVGRNWGKRMLITIYYSQVRMKLLLRPRQPIWLFFRVQISNQTFNWRVILPWSIMLPEIQASMWLKSALRPSRPTKVPWSPV